MSTQATQEERAHHPYSPSSLQNREACPCYQNRGGTSKAAETGTRQHGVVETGLDDHKLGDDKALAAAECLDFYQREKQIMEDAREKANQALIEQARAAGVATYVPPAAVLDLAEIYLPVDECKFEDVHLVTHKDPETGLPFVKLEPYTFEATTAGYIDRALISHCRTRAVMLDWKFGMWAVEEAKNNLQGISYSLGLFRQYPSLESIKFYFKMPHLDYMTEATFTRENIPALYLRVQTVVARAKQANGMVLLKGDYSMAVPHVPVCNFCGRLGECPKVAEVACFVGKKFFPLEIPSDLTPTGLKDMTEVGIGMRLSQVMDAWAKAYRARVTERTLRSAGTGKIEIPEGFSVVQVTPRELKDKKAFKTIAENYLTKAELEDLAEYTFGKVEDAISDKAPRGTKTAKLEQFDLDLRAAGAVVDGEPYAFLKGVSKKPAK